MIQREKVWIVHVTTEAEDSYLWAYVSKPMREQLIRRVWSMEGCCEDLSWYEATVRIEIKEVELE